MLQGRSIQTSFRQGGTIRPIQALLTLLVLVWPQFLLAMPVGFSDDELARLERGEILLRPIQKNKPGVAMRVAALLHSNTNEVWQVLGDCNYELIYVKGLKLCEVLGGNQIQMKVHHRVRNSWYSPTLDFVFSATRYSDESGETSLISGDLKVFEGTWKLTPIEGMNSVIVTHEIRLQPKFLAPKWLVRRVLNKDLPDMMACIRGLASASGTERHITRDLKRCPGDISLLAK